MTEIGTISNCENGVDVVFEWKIENFFNLPKSDGLYYFSPYFSFGGKKWCMEIFPNGSDRNDSSGHVELWLFICDSSCSIKQSFSFSVKTIRGETYNKQHFMKDFDIFNSTHICNSFILRSELTRNRFELVPEGTLTVICTMKSSTSAENASNTASAECHHCKGTFNADSLSLHQKKCMHRPTMCPDCLEVVVLQKWLEEHECQNEGQGGARSLCEDYKKMLLGGRHHDLILKVGDKELQAHRNVLRARSKFFEFMLDHDMKEKNTGIIDLPDCDPNAMELFLSYVYCGKIEALDSNNMLGLYYIADKYEMMELKRECCNFIKKSLSLTNICSAIQLALKHSDSDLLEYATGYFSDNVLDIMQTVECNLFSWTILQSGMNFL